jgi:hypothetical protein
MLHVENLPDAPEALVEHCAPAPKATPERVATAPVTPVAPGVCKYRFDDAKNLYQWLADNGAIATDDDWVMAGMVAKAEFGEAGLELWEILATEGGLSDESKKRWKSFGAREGRDPVRLGTLTRLARDAGWTGQVLKTTAYMFRDVVARLAANAGATLARPSPEEMAKLAEDLRAGGFPMPGPCDIEGEPETISPIDLWEKFDPPALKPGMVPAIIERFAVDQGRATGADPAGFVISALVVCAAALPDSIRLQVKKHNTGWLESARIWGALVGEPSRKKTPIISIAVKPLAKIDAEYSKMNSVARAKYNALSTKEKRQTPPPPQPRAVLQSVTIEAAQEILRDNERGLLCYHDELAGFFGSLDKYSGGGKASATDRAFWLQSYNGGAFTSDRIGRGATYLPNLSACLLGGVQQSVIRRIAGDCLDDGLLQRFLPIVLRESEVGTDEPMSQDIFHYNTLVRFLHGLKGELTLHFDESAQNIRAELEKKHKVLEAFWEKNTKLATHIGKYDGIFARLCVLFHCIGCGAAGFGPLPVISEATARSVAEFLHGFLFWHAAAFYTDVIGLSDSHDHVTRVADYILAHGLEKITIRDVARGDRAMRALDKKAVEAIFDQLHAMGWIDRTAGRQADVWLVNPQVHIEHAERAVREKERRDTNRELLAEMFAARPMP